MRNEIKAVGKYLKRDKIKAACKKIEQAYSHCDSDRRPKDNIIGDAVRELADMILGLKRSLECK